MNKTLWLIILSCSISIISSCTAVATEVADCAWSAPLLTWNDTNENGVWDDGEQPIEGVRFEVNDVLNNYENVGAQAVSDWEGKAQASVWLAGCPSAKFEVLAFSPEGYSFVSDQVVEIKGSGYGSDDPILFPLNRKGGYATPTVYAPKLQCITFPIGAEDLKIAPDGSVWAATAQGGAIYKDDLGEWQTIPFDPDSRLLADDIDIGIEGDVWIRPWNRIGLLQNGHWEMNSSKDTFPANMVSSINYLDDEGLWFAPAPPDMFAQFDPSKSSWSLYGPQSRATDVNLRVTLMQGLSTWFAVFEYHPGDAPLPEVPFPGWSIQNSHKFTDEDFKVVPVQGWIKDIEIDATGKLWIASGGISSFLPSTAEWTNFEPNSILDYSTPPEDIAVGPDNAIWSIYSDVHPRLLRLEPNEINPSESEWIAFDPRDGFPDDTGVTSLAIDWQGNIWIGFGLSEVTVRCKTLN